MAALLGVSSLGISACGLLIGLDDHQAFPPEADAGEDVDERPDAPADALADVVEDALPDVVTDACAGTICGDKCVDTATSATNCGACGSVCTTNFACEAGVCGDHIEQISAGANHGCALLHDGSIWCWGNNTSGQLGFPVDPNTTCSGMYSCHPAPSKVGGLQTKMIQVAAGADVTCAIDSAGAVWCWGANDSLQLGRPTAMGSPNPNVDPTPAKVPGLPPMAQVAVGYGFACARAADGSKVYCWGSNLAGALGNGQKEGSAVGVPPGDVVALPAGVVDISTGLNDHVCALTSSQQVWCWGSNTHGQLGHSSVVDPACGMTKCTSTPSVVATLALSGSKLSASAIGTCAETTTGFACWGGNVYGQLGSKPETIEHSSPTPVSQGLDALPATFQGSYAASCVLGKSGVNCWGDDTYGELGRGGLTSDPCASGGVCDPVPGEVKLSTGGAHRQVATGTFWTMVLTDDNRIFAWGANVDGRLGHAPGDLGDLKSCGFDGQQLCSPTPMLVPQPGSVP